MVDVPRVGMEVENPAEILREQDGAFEVTSPYGHVFRVICRRGRKMDIQEIGGPERVETHRPVWRIRPLARSVAA